MKEAGISSSFECAKIFLKSDDVNEIQTKEDLQEI
jgi:hypothetical protein